jgi:hypothetical protein
MNLPVSFSEISYYDDEYRGDLIITGGVIYFFPQKRSAYDKIYLFGGVFDRILNWLFRSVLMFVAGAGIQDLIEFVTTFGRFAKRGMSGKNTPKIAKLGLWREGQTDRELQQKLDKYLLELKDNKLDFSKESLPKPFAFKVSEMSDISFKWKFKFNTKFDDHDFGISFFNRKSLRAALQKAGFLK